MATLSIPDPSGLSRRRFLQLAGAGATAAAAAAVWPDAGSAASPAAGRTIKHDRVAATYLRVLQRHTRWAETQWDASSGHYLNDNFSFAVVLGNAVILTRGDYDATAAGVDAATLREHTVATIEHFAASNRLVGGSEWGRTLFFDTTFQLYFQLAGRLLWHELDDVTRTNLDTIAAGQAEYTTGLGSADDPASGTWTPNGLQGGWIGDTKLEEMGVYAQSIVPGLAWTRRHKGAPAWRAAYEQWSRNETGLPQADQANPALVDGVPVSANTAHNLYDTFLVENHGSFGPHYQCELWRTSGRNAIHFMTAGQKLPEVLTHQPNGEQLWRTILGVMSDAGEPLMPMVADREHLYGRDVIPLAFLAQVQGDRRAAYAEAALADRLEAYQAYPPEDRVTKFSGEPKYEPEARAEIAISYLLHEWRARNGQPVAPLRESEFWRSAAAVTDFGVGPGLVSHQSAAAWAGAVSKPGFVKFAWQPRHDDWLFRLSGATPMFLPAVTATVGTRSARIYERVRDGFDASVTVLGLDSGTAGFATLPDGGVVYATTGTGPDEGRIEVINLTMPGVPGLDGTRSYASPSGTVDVASADAGTQPVGVARRDTSTFTSRAARYVRMLGVQPAPTYGYSIIELAVRSGADGADLALGRTTTASSADTGHAAPSATDGDLSSRWAVARADRTRSDSWLVVDLGNSEQIDRVTIDWESAAGRAYDVQISADGTSWQTVASYPTPDLTTHGWLSVDGRAGFVVRGSDNPITVTGDVVTLATGSAAGSASLLVEGYPGAGARAIAAVHAAPTPSASALRVSTAQSHLVLFNLTDDAVTEDVTLPVSDGSVPLYLGRQRITARASAHRASVPARDGKVLAPWFTLSAPHGLPARLTAEVIDARSVRLSGGPGVVWISSAQERGRRKVVLDGHARTVTFAGAEAFPGDDLALGRTTFPTTPLPAGMTDPAAAVDGSARTVWRPGPAGRMVVDLGAATAVGEVRLEWTGGRAPSAVVEISDDGVTYGRVARADGRTASVRVRQSARYVAVSVRGPDARSSALRTLSVFAP